MNYYDDVQKLSEESVRRIRKFIEEKRASAKYKDTFVNPILREDIFDVLSSEERIVVYYPLEDEENDGFHVQMPVGGEKKHFVYINTAKPLEKQIYAAAHELGHIWTDNGRRLGEEPQSPEEDDVLMNRFAAELLMPAELFGPLATKKLGELSDEPGKISEENFFRAAAFLMDEYFVPFYAVVRRLGELNIMTGKTCRYIEEQLYKEDPNGKKTLRDCINEGGYSKLLAGPNKKRSMTGFRELLDRAEEKGIFRPQKVAYLREKLNLPKVDGLQGTLELLETDEAKNTEDK